MFSTMPSIGTFTAWNICAARFTSAIATCCGLETRMAPLTGKVCTKVIWMSPVPGGRSTTI